MEEWSNGLKLKEGFQRQGKAALTRFPMDRSWSVFATMVFNTPLIQYSLAQTYIKGPF